MKWSEVKLVNTRIFYHLLSFFSDRGLIQIQQKNLRTWEFVMKSLNIHHFITTVFNVTVSTVSALCIYNVSVSSSFRIQTHRHKTCVISWKWHHFKFQICLAESLKMTKLREETRLLNKLTHLEKTFPCNYNITVINTK